MFVSLAQLLKVPAQLRVDPEVPGVVELPHGVAELTVEVDQRELPQVQNLRYELLNMLESRIN